MEIVSSLFNKSGQPIGKFKDHSGINSICKLYGAVEDKWDLWLIYELCGTPLSKLLFETKG